LKKLGLLLTSDRYPHYVIHLARAAHAKGLSVHIYITGTAVKLIRHPEFIDLHKMVKISVGSEAAADFPAMDHVSKTLTPFAVSSEQMCGFIQECDRYVVL
jgi:phosphoribosylcarboxyaminoimidazole (NCAIR) mutase